MPDLTLREIRKHQYIAQQNLYDAINSAVKKFHRDTGLSIKSIDVNLINSQGLGQELPQYLLDYVSVEVETGF